MASGTRFLKFASLIILIFSVSCTTPRHNKAGVELAMKRYDHLILKLDANGIAELFTPDGKLGEMARGRDSIRKFLSSFKNIRVISQSSSSTSIYISGDSAIQQGTYRQSDIISGKDTVNVKGEFTATWQWVQHKGWYIRQMSTRSVN